MFRDVPLKHSASWSATTQQMEHLPLLKTKHLARVAAPRCTIFAWDTNLWNSKLLLVYDVHYSKACNTEALWNIILIEKININLDNYLLCILPCNACLGFPWQVATELSDNIDTMISLMISLTGVYVNCCMEVNSVISFPSMRQLDLSYLIVLQLS